MSGKYSYKQINATLQVNIAIVFLANRLRHEQNNCCFYECHRGEEFQWCHERNRNMSSYKNKDRMMLLPNVLSMLEAASLKLLEKV